jgi:hypothetical protein
LIRTDTLDFAIFTRHGDSCGCQPANPCYKGYHPDDYVLAAKFTYLQEALDVIQKWQARGVSCKLRSKTYGKPAWQFSDYPAKKEATTK